MAVDAIKSERNILPLSNYVDVASTVFIPIGKATLGHNQRNISAVNSNEYRDSRLPNILSMRV